MNIIMNATTLKIIVESVGDRICPAVRFPSNEILFERSLSKTENSAPYLVCIIAVCNSCILENVPPNMPFKVCDSAFVRKSFNPPTPCKTSPK